MSAKKIVVNTLREDQLDDVTPADLPTALAMIELYRKDRASAQAPGNVHVAAALGLPTNTPTTIVEILQAMKAEDDRMRDLLPKSGKGSGDWNPVWKVLATHVRELQECLDAYAAPLEFKYVPGRPLLIVKLGSEARGWIPNAHDFCRVRKILKAAGEDERANILMHHYAIHVEERSRSPLVAHRMDCGQVGASAVCPCQESPALD